MKLHKHSYERISFQTCNTLMPSYCLNPLKLLFQWREGLSRQGKDTTTHFNYLFFMERCVLCQRSMKWIYLVVGPKTKYFPLAYLHNNQLSSTLPPSYVDLGTGDVHTSKDREENVNKEIIISFFNASLPSDNNPILSVVLRERQ